MTETPRVSVIITAYNEAGRISEALASLTEQDLDDFEIVVFDDGSSDGTAEAARAFGDSRIRVIESARIGRAAALHLAVEATRGRYVANLDADDVALPGRLSAQADFLDASPETAWVGGAEEMVDERRGERFLRRYPESDSEIRRQAARCIPYSHSGIMFRRALVDEGLNYDPSQPFLIDFEFFLRVAERHRVANLGRPVVRRIVRAESYFQSRFRTWEQNLCLSRLCARAVLRFGLPIRHLAYPLARLLYPALPASLKRRIRGRQGLRETPDDRACSAE